MLLKSILYYFLTLLLTSTLRAQEISVREISKADQVSAVNPISEATSGFVYKMKVIRDLRLNKDWKIYNLYYYCILVRTLKI